jgi:hypothetical protein
MDSEFNNEFERVYLLLYFVYSLTNDKNLLCGV